MGRPDRSGGMAPPTSLSSSTFRQGASATVAVDIIHVTPSQRPPHNVLGVGGARLLRTLGAPRVNIKVPGTRSVEWPCPLDGERLGPLRFVDVPRPLGVQLLEPASKLRNTGNR
jgi:hypothetical protein